MNKFPPFTAPTPFVEPPPFTPPQPFTYPPFNPTCEEWERGKLVAEILQSGLNPSDVLK